MSLIFLSHSSADEREAVALQHWLADNGWNDVFLDVDPQRGLAAGERWQDALRKAADRCEAVVFIVSPAWAKSKWCLAEFLLAKSLHKLIFGVVLKEVPIGELPTEMTAEWQLCRLVGNGSTETIHFPYRETTNEIAFLAEGLRRLREGLHKAGLNADFFPWPPKDDPQRAPYRGLEPLGASDAAVFFGRDVEILRGLDALRGMRDGGDKKLFVILGASGAGKSSFLRAGLLPRLARDDRHFFPLAPIRPERDPLFGERGLAYALHRALLELKLPVANLGNIKARLREGPAGLAGLIQQLQDALCVRMLGLAEAASPPTIVLPVDQAEELFNADAGDDARSILRLIGGVLRGADADLSNDTASVPMIVAFTIRSDRYEPLQTAPELAGLQSVVFDDLKPMPPTRYREVILGPALRATAEGERLRVEPDLVDRLVGECSEGGDALPLLGLTLARLYRDYGDDGDLRLDEYQAMGGLTNIVKTEAESVLAGNEPMRQQQLELLRAAFVPWLATINPQNDQPMRRMARRADLPADSHVLLDALAEKRLLLTDQRDGVAVVEVAHEALLRQWDVLTTWLASERENLKDADVLERAVQAWETSGRKDAWLMEGERLTIVETLAAKPGFSRRVEGCREFLLASRRREDARREEEERRRQAELQAAQHLAAEQERRAEVEAQARRDAEASAAGLRVGRRKLIGALAGVFLVAVAAVWLFFQARQSEQTAIASSARANALRLVAEAQAMLSGARIGGDERALLQLLAARRTAPDGVADDGLANALLQRRDLRTLITTDAKVTTVAFSPDGSRIVSGSDDRTLRLWDARNGLSIGKPLKGQEERVSSVAFSPDGSRIVSSNGGLNDHTLLLWDARNGQQIGEPLKGHDQEVTSVAFSPDGSRIVSGSADKTLRLWDAGTGRPIGAPLEGKEAVWSVAYSPDGSRIVSGGGGDNTLILWNASTNERIVAPLAGHKGTVMSVAFSPDGSRIVSGGADKTLRLCDANTGESIGAPLAGHDNLVSSVAFSPDGSRIVSGSWDTTLRLWDASADQPKGVSIVAHMGWVSRDGSRIVSEGENNTLRLWDASTGQLIGVPLEGHRGTVSSVTFSPDGSRIVSGSYDKTLRLWDAKTGRPLSAPLAAQQRPVSRVAFSPDGSRIVSGGGDGTLRLWDASTGQPMGAPLAGHKGEVSSVAFSPDGSRVVSGGGDGTLRLWDASTGQPMGAPLEGHKGTVSDVAFSPDGSRIVSGGGDMTLRLRDSKTGRLIGAPLKGHQSGVLSVDFSPDGRYIVSGDDSTLRFWDANTGQPIGPPLEGHRSGVFSVAFSFDGRRIVSSSGDKTLRLWPAPAAWPDELCAKLTRNMSRKQWRDWVSPDAKYECQCPGLPIPPDDPNSTAAPELCPGEPAQSMFP